MIKQTLLLLIAGTIILSCKKGNTENPIDEPAKTAFSATINGVKFTADAKSINGTLFTDAADPIKAFEVNAQLEASKKIIVFLGEIKAGKITIVPKTSGSPATQSFIRYINGTTSYYALSGAINIATDAVKKLITVTWEATFNDGTKDFTATGSFTIVDYEAAKKSKTAIKNNNPIAIDDNFTTDFETKLNNTVAANDSDADGGTLTYTAHTQPANGTLVFNANGSFEYTPKTGFSGTDSFEYTVKDDTDLTAKASVTITVKQKPVTPTQTASLKRNGTEVSHISSTKLIYNKNIINGNTIWTCSVNIATNNGAAFIDIGLGNKSVGVQLGDNMIFDFNDPNGNGQNALWGYSQNVFWNLKYEVRDNPNSNYIKIVSFNEAAKTLSVEGKLQFSGNVYEFSLSGTYTDQ